MNLHSMANHIELWLIDKLIPYARNPRTHSDAQIAQIAASIVEFGFNNPILVDSKARSRGAATNIAARGGQQLPRYQVPDRDRGSSSSTIPWPVTRVKRYALP